MVFLISYLMPQQLLCTKCHHCMLYYSAELSTICCFSLVLKEVARKMWSLTQNHHQLWLWSLCQHETNHILTERTNMLGMCTCLWQPVTQLGVCCTGVNPDSFQELILHTNTGPEQITHFAHQNGGEKKLSCEVFGSGLVWFPHQSDSGNVKWCWWLYSQVAVDR